MCNAGELLLQYFSQNTSELYVCPCMSWGSLSFRLIEALRIQFRFQLKKQLWFRFSLRVRHKNKLLTTSISKKKLALGRSLVTVVSFNVEPHCICWQFQGVPASGLMHVPVLCPLFHSRLFEHNGWWLYILRKRLGVNTIYNNLVFGNNKKTKRHRCFHRNTFPAECLALECQK